MTTAIKILLALVKSPLVTNLLIPVLLNLAEKMFNKKKRK